MSTTVRLDLINEGVRAVALTSPEVRAMITARAEAVAIAAGSAAVPVIVRNAGISRARSYVVIDLPYGAAMESKHRYLGTALDAARG